MRAKGPRYKKDMGGRGCHHLGTMSADVSPVCYPGRKRKAPKDAHPAGKKKKEPAIQTMTPEDCDPVVREVVEDT